MSAAAKQTVSETDHGRRPEGEIRPVPHGALLTRLERGDAARPRFPNRGMDDASEPAMRQANGQTVRRVPVWIERLLRIPLPVKLVGANVLLLIVAAATALVLRHRELSSAPLLTVVIVAYLVALLLNTGLVMLAVRPLRVLEKTVDTIWHGDLDARVPTSLLADRHVTRVARMFNILLDG